MSESITIQVNTQDLRKALVAMPGLLRENVADAFDHIGRKFYKTLWKQTEVKTRPNVGIGKYSRYTVFGKGRRNPRSVGLVIYSYSQIARAHEEGARITGNLAIPIGEALTGTGRKRKIYKQNLQDVKGLFPVETGGKMYLAKTTRKATKFLFALRRSVTLKPRLKFYRTWDDLAGFTSERINKAVDQTLQKVERL